MLGAFFALVAAACFAWTNAAVRRGVRSGTVVQATAISLPIGVPVFLLALLLTGRWGAAFKLPSSSVWIFAAVGVSHFCVGRYCNYRAINAIGTNLAGPVMQFNLVVSLVLAILFLGETLTPLRILGIVLIAAGPMIIRRERPQGGASEKVATEVSFTPRFAEGYFFALLAAFCYGATPPLIRYATNEQGLVAGLAGGLIGSIAATIVVLLLLLLIPGQWRQLRKTEPEAAKWFLFSGVLVYVSQIFGYMAFAIAPVTVAAPVMGLANIFRLHFSRWLNPQHEVFGSEVLIATAVSFLGVIALSLSLDVLPVPAAWRPLLEWHWP